MLVNSEELIGTAEYLTL